MSSKLNQLLEKNNDAEAGYKRAAKIVEAPRLKRFFETQAQNRNEFGQALRSEINNIGGEFVSGTSITGDVHRTWMDVKSSLSSNDRDVILEEVIRGERAALTEYKGIVYDAALPPSTKSVIVKQMVSVENALKSTENFEIVYS
ncbi:hypothetical protein SCB49_08843 [unidentified eubacterium SCB49]|nr:hypothetical protein SCB49_08843 [unidentified eubacterium SCB49]